MHAMDCEIWEHLPDHLLTKIFARLPLRSLFQIEVLSKAWQGKFLSPAFQNEVTAEISARWDSFSPLWCTGDGLVELLAYSRSSGKWRKLFSLSSILSQEQASTTHGWRVVSISGSLLCLKQVGEPGQRKMLVTNPLIKSFKALPSPGMATSFLPVFEITHIVTSSASTEPSTEPSIEGWKKNSSSSYKVISISQDSTIRDPYKDPKLPVRDLVFDHLEHRPVGVDFYRDMMFAHLERRPVRVEVYDSTTGVWEVRENGPTMVAGPRHLSSVYMNGKVFILLASSMSEPFQLFAYDIGNRSWTEVPRPLPQVANRLAQLVVCGSHLLVVVFTVTPRLRNQRFGLLFSDRCIDPGSISVFKVDSDGFRVTPVAEGPDENIQEVDIVEGIAGDEECIYLQVFGRPIVMVFNLRERRWSTLSLDSASDGSQPALEQNFGRLRKLSSRYFGASFNWTNCMYQPGIGPFIRP